MVRKTLNDISHVFDYPNLQLSSCPPYILEGTGTFQNIGGVPRVTSDKRLNGEFLFGNIRPESTHFLPLSTSSFAGSTASAIMKSRSIEEC